MKILFVCLGNICRSPTAEGVFREQLARHRLADSFQVDSAGTGAWHAGEPPDRRMRTAAKKKGYVLDGQARQVKIDDFRRFDLILAMDGSNYEDLRRLQPEDGTARLQKFRDFDPEAPGDDTPDPYYGGPAGFDEVVEICERTSLEILVRYGRGELLSEP
ncbi:MAG: low molecular weight protein-tyrosine-phosphatase [Myxococcota bacterium]